jgi:hypothetical protein
MKASTPNMPGWRNRRRGLTLVLATCAVAGSLGIYFTVGPASAHDQWDWIREGDFRDAAGQPCCDIKDCKMIPVNSAEVIELDGGDFKYMPTGEVIPRRETRQSPDHNYWRCHWYENGQQVTRKLCFWRPARDS